jgi:hypothetical protein
MTLLSKDDEFRLRELAAGLAKGVEEDQVLLARLGFTREDYDELTQTRTFKVILDQAFGEWGDASNTHKRIKLKAAVNVEEALPSFYQAMINTNEPLSSRVKVLEIVSKIGGLGNPEPVAAGVGQYFKLEINLGIGKPPLVIEHGVEDVALEHSKSEIVQSKVWDDVEKNEL